MNIENIKNIGKEPIKGDSPVGEDVSYEPNFEALNGEIEKLSSPTAEGGGINWQRVAELGVTILRDESKNLVVGCYLNVALLYTDGLQGFAVGVHILRNLMETWWDNMYPPKKRKKGRVNILNWWEGKLQQLLSEQKTETWPKERRQLLLDDLNAIDGLIADKLEDGPMLRSLTGTVSQLLNEEAPPPEPEPPAEPEDTPPEQPPKKEEIPQKQPEKNSAEPASPPPEAPKPKKPSVKPMPVSVPDDADANVYLQQGLELLGRAATHVFQANPSKTLPYQLNRFVAWSELDELPPAANGVSMVPPPNDQIVSILETMFRAENWEDLLEAAESRVREHLFWLDLSYYSFRALKGCGYMLAAQAVENETRLHVLRLPGIESISFSDERPFASQQTKSWLASAPAAQEKAASQADAQSAAEGEHEVSQDVEEAARLCAGSGIQSAIAWLAEQKKTASSPRRQFMYDVGFCRLLFQADRTEMALSFAEKMLMLIDCHKLEKWEPELAAQGLLESCRCLLQAGDEEEIVQKRKQISERLSLLAPDQMLSLI
jgi:type VI secretion system protein VasJ